MQTKTLSRAFARLAFAVAVTSAVGAALAGAHDDMEGAFLARERHLQALREAALHLAAAAQHLARATPPLELFAEELRAAQLALAAIVGEFSSDDLLGAIFSRFCIGK